MSGLGLGECDYGWMHNILNTAAVKNDLISRKQPRNSFIFARFAKNLERPY